MNRFFITTFFVILMAGSACFSSERVALVIGINDYPDEDSSFRDLRNCVPDAKLIAKTLREVGFDVIEKLDPNLIEIEMALEEFEERIEPGGTAFVYFAGHGIEFEGHNYLMASNARLRGKSWLQEEGVKADEIAGMMVAARAASSFLLLDCCREHPPAEWASRGIKGKGLSKIPITGDLMIGMAAAPGQVAYDGRGEANSPYAKALAKWIPSGKNHLEVLLEVGKEVYKATDGQQKPWSDGSFLDFFHFTNSDESSLVQSQASVEMLPLLSVNQSGDAPLFDDFPTGNSQPINQIPFDDRPSVMPQTQPVDTFTTVTPPVSTTNSSFGQSTLPPSRVGTTIPNNPTIPNPKTTIPTRQQMNTSTAPPQQTQLPYGKVVPGRPNEVYSPYNPTVRLSIALGAKPGDVYCDPHANNQQFRLPADYGQQNGIPTITESRSGVIQNYRTYTTPGSGRNNTILTDPTRERWIPRNNGGAIVPRTNGIIKIPTGGIQLRIGIGD